MFTHLLVTLDGTPSAEAVIPHATDLALAMHAEITLLRIVDAASTDWGERGAIGRPQSTAIRSSYVEGASAYLENIAAQMQARGITAHAVVKQGAAAKQIVAAANEAEADVIAMATHSRRGLGRLMFGSVAEAVLHESHLPIILIRAE